MIRPDFVSLTFGLFRFRVHPRFLFSQELFITVITWFGFFISRLSELRRLNQLLDILPAKVHAAVAAVTMRARGGE